MDQLGWVDTRVIPVTSAMLTGTTASALSAPEPSWDQPRDAGYQGGGWGSERILLFEGLRTGVSRTRSMSYKSIPYHNIPCIICLSPSQHPFPLLIVSH
jgi:hypothetical protein